MPQQKNTLKIWNVFFLLLLQKISTKMVWFHMLILVLGREKEEEEEEEEEEEKSWLFCHFFYIARG